MTCTNIDIDDELVAEAMRRCATTQRRAAICWLARYGGRTVRSLMDCLIAAVAIRRNATLVDCDQDFNVIASCVSLPSLSLL
jgi:Arc/MetJ family transcription regulator